MGILFTDREEVVGAGQGENILFEGKIYDIKGEKFVFGKRYQAESSLIRLVAHKISDEIMKIFGEKTIFTSKINKLRDYMPAWSADGEKIAYTSYRSHKASLLILNPYQGKITNVISKGTNFAPAFSADGKKLAFCSTADEGNPEIYVATSDGNRIKRLTFNKAIDTAPSWSPTSREIAFTSDRGGTPQIYIMDAEGSNVRRVSFGGSYHDAPAWSPTGDRIAYVSRVNQIFDIYVINLRTKQIIKLTESNARNESPCWSPDGRHLVFSSNLAGTIQLYTIDYDGANLRRLTSKGENKLADWSR